MRQLDKQALWNYNNFKKSQWIGGDPAYAPLLEWLRLNHSNSHNKCRIFNQIPILQEQKNRQPDHSLFTAMLQDIITGATGIGKYASYDLFAKKEIQTLNALKVGHGRRLHSYLNMPSLSKSAWRDPEKLMQMYENLKQYCHTISPRIRGLDSMISEFDRKLNFFKYSGSGRHTMRYQEFPDSPLDTLIQPHIDCCLFNGHSRHRAATVAFLAHPSIRLLALYDTHEQKAVGAAIEADMVDDQGRTLRVLDSVEIGDCRNKLSIHYGWKQLTVHGVILRCRRTCPKGTHIFFNTGYDKNSDRGYLSHVSAAELADWLKKRFPVNVILLKLKFGLDPLKAKGAVDPRINLEVISTQKRNDMFNLGMGSGVGIRIDPWDKEHLNKIDWDQRYTFVQRICNP